MKEIQRLYYFNPDNEIALAHNCSGYTPPQSVISYMDRLALLPALYATPGSGILVSDRIIDNIGRLPYYDILKSRDMKCVPFSALDHNSEILPWGWNQHLYQYLEKHGLNTQLMPSLNLIARYRELAHRATTIKVFNHINDDQLNSRIPVFLASKAEANAYMMQFESESAKDYPVVKFPWSSSGRGVFMSPSPKTFAKILTRRQGVIIEPLWDKAIDFATEWFCSGGKARFEGYSIFLNTSKGQYEGNIVASQAYIRHKILQHCSEELLDKRLRALNSALNFIVAPHYTGPLGVDMLCDREGEINPCVEINLRMTMGHVAIRINEIFNNSPDTAYIFKPGESLSQKFCVYLHP